MTFEQIKNLTQKDIIASKYGTYMFNEFVYTIHNNKRMIAGAKVFKLVVDSYPFTRNYIIENDKKFGYTNDMLLIHELRRAEIIPDEMEVD